MRISQVSNSQMGNNKQSQSFGAFRLPRNSGALGDSILFRVRQNVPLRLEFEIHGLDYLVYTVKDMNYLSRLKRESSKIAFKKYLADNAPLLTLDKVKGKSKTAIEKLVSISEEQFRAFVANDRKTIN